MNITLIRPHDAGRSPVRDWRRFARHFAEMSAVMVAGMLAAAAVFVLVLDQVVGRELTWDGAVATYPVHALLAIAVGMSLPMVPWMRHRGHSRRSAYEMGVVMGLLAVPFACLALLHVVRGAVCGLYCLSGFVVMAALMAYRRDEYLTHAHR